jgi:regulator of protease activity HflC (stomatin/prohibitin superfamily)
MQEVQARVAINYRINEQDVDKLYKNIGESYETIILNPAVSESVRSTTAKYTSDELISKRIEVSEQIKSLLTEKLIGKYVSIDSLNIISFEFSENFNKAIEEKQIAEQETMKAKHELEKIRIETEAKLLLAKSEYDALMLMKEVGITDEMLLLEYIKKWDGMLPDSMGENDPVVLPEGSGTTVNDENAEN